MLDFTKLMLRVNGSNAFSEAGLRSCLSFEDYEKVERSTSLFPATNTSLSCKMEILH